MPRLETLIVRDDRPAERRWIDRVKDSLRAYWQGPWSSSEKILAEFLNGTGPVSSGVVVNDLTALGVSAFYGAVVGIASDIASLPCFLFRKLPTGGSERFESHPLNFLLHDQPNPHATPFAWRQTLMLNALTAGNGYAEIVRDAIGRPRELWNIAPERVSPFYERGELDYRVDGSVVLPAANMIHLKGASPNGVAGLDLVAVAKEVIGMTIAAQTHGARYFGNGATLAGILSEGSAGLSAVARENLLDAIKKRNTGVHNAHGLLLVPNDMKYTELGKPPRDSQLVELREFQVREIARFLRLPASKLGANDNITYANTEARQLEYVTSCLRPWLVALEQELSQKLIARSERNLQHVEHVLDALLRADSQGRAVFLEKMVAAGIMSINEARARESLPAIPGFDLPVPPRVRRPSAPAPRTRCAICSSMRSIVSDSRMSTNSPEPPPPRPFVNTANCGSVI
jgi:HK97 family phage portal protein